MRKIYHGRLPLDNNIKRMGIQLASKCHCCYNHSQEDQEHVFFESLNPKATWNYIMSRIGLRNRGNTLMNFLKNWWCRTKPNSTRSAIFHTIPELVVWEIWKARCSAAYEDLNMSVHRSMKMMMYSSAEYELVLNPLNLSYSSRMIHDLLKQASLAYYYSSPSYSEARIYKPIEDRLSEEELLNHKDVEKWSSKCSDQKYRPRSAKEISLFEAGSTISEGFLNRVNGKGIEFYSTESLSEVSKKGIDEIRKKNASRSTNL